MSSTSLDLSKLTQLHVGLSLLANVGVSPGYNLPIALYGLAMHSASQEHLFQFTILLAASFVLDIIFLIIWRHDYSTWTVFLVLANMAAKPVTFLASQTNKPFTVGGHDEPVFSAMPGGFNASAHQAQAPAGGSYQGSYRFAADEPASDEEEEPASTSNKDKVGGYQAV